MITDQFKAVRRAGVPICCIESADPAATHRACFAALNGKMDSTPICRWDIIQGLTGLNERGKDFVADVAPQGPLQTGNPSECLSLLASCDRDKLKDTIVFFHNAHRFITNESVAQGIWNCRDTFKTVHACLVLLAPQITLPSELKHDVYCMSEPLPGDAELAGIVDSIASDAQLPADAIGKDKDRIVDTMRGLSAFAAEQVLALSVRKDSIDQGGLWERKRKLIEQTPGLAVWQGGESFEDLGGLSNLKEFLTLILTSGKTPVRAIGFIDEIEKGLAGSAGDTSGTSQDQLQVFLKVMQDLNIPGLILVGHAGTGKSCIAKAAGAVAQCPVISIDTGAMKGSLVGESEAKIRAAMEVFKAVSQGKGLFIATCNKISSLPPELRRRFTLGTFFVDLPSEEERKQIWALWCGRYKVKAEMAECLSISKDWTGAEIRACCDVSFRTGLTLAKAAAFVVPVIKSAPDQVEALRKLAHGRFINAAKSGVYRYADDSNQGAQVTGRRVMES
jgi:hypothetical protein